MLRFNMTLLLVLVVCALALVTSQHRARKLFQELEREQERARQLDVEFGQLQLEMSTWATHPRIEKIARERLRMVQPDVAGRPILAAAPAMGGR
ncbi:MAG: cell division protein FtsL [Betaproteobacteria bacterium]|nr:cell division protein FtsL [Betaproteobacteria bacterium]